MNAYLLWQLVAWFALGWFVSAGLMALLMQLLLPRAWDAIRAAPPRGPGWANSLWYGREKIYGGVMALALLIGVLTAGSYALLR